MQSEITADHIHKFIESDKEGYEICTECGTYHSIAQLPPDEIYINNNYWGEGTGRSSLEEQIGNLTNIDECGISKVDRILQFVPDGKLALEIACAPGMLLNKLSERGYEVFGVEPSSKYIEFICQTAPQAKIINGYFPQVFSPDAHDTFDCIIGMDIYEHVENGNEFIMSIYRLLKEGGTAILMSPIIYEDGLMRERDFIASEHCWIYTKKYLEPYLKSIFKAVKFTQWILGHQILILIK